MTAQAVFHFLFEASNLDSQEQKSEPNSFAIDDQQLFLRSAISTHLAPLLHKTLSITGIPSLNSSLVKNQLRNSYNQVLSRNIILQHVFIDFVALLYDNRLPVLPLKGIYLCEAIYKDIGLRHLSDIDVLIKDKNLDEICELMNAQGWDVKHTLKRSELEDQLFAHAHPRTLVKNDIRIELHTHLYNGDQVKGLSKEELWNDTSTVNFMGVEVYQFSNEMLLQHLCMHLHKHLIGHELKILSFCDIREFLRVKQNEFDWSRFEALTSKYGYLEEVSQVLYLSHKYWNVGAPLHLRETKASTKELEDRFWSYVSGDSRNEDSILKSKLSIRRRDLEQLNSTNKKMKWIAGFVFPTPQFMRQCYGLKNDSWLFPWYIYRPLTLIGKTIKALFSPS